MKHFLHSNNLFFKRAIAKNILSSIAVILCIFLITDSTKAQLYQQTFTTPFATVTSGPVTDANYVSATPSSSQLTYLATNTSGTNTMTASGGTLQINIGGTGGAWAAARTADFAPVPSTMRVSFDATIDVQSSGSNPKFFFYVGSGFSNNLTAEASANIHSGFSLRYASSSYFYAKTLANTGTESAATQITDNTSLNFTFVTNNSGATINYTAPDGSPATLINDAYDLYIGNILRLDDQVATTAGQTLSQIKFGDLGTSSAGRAVWILDNLTVDALTPAAPTITTSVSALTGFTQAAATPTAGQSYTVSGAALTAPVTVTASAGFQISLDSTIWVSTFDLPVSSGTVTGQPKKIFVRMNDASAGAHSGNITHTSTGATTVNVAVSGNTVTTPTLAVNPASLAFGQVVLGSSSAEKSYTITGYLLNPASGNITIVPPSNYFVSLTPGTGYAPALSIPYTGGSLATTTIYVTFIPSAVANYNSNITNSGGSAVSTVAVTGAGVLQQVGDFGSVATGLWSAAGTWKIWDGTGFNTTATTAPTSTANVFINAGHTVTIDASGKVCNNLQVETNGTLISSSTAKSPYYLNMSGTLLTVNTGGQMGTLTTGDLADGLSVNVANASFVITGTGGTINLSRLRTNAANTNLVINHDLTLNYHGTTNQGGHTVAFYPQAGDNLTVTINAGKTMTFAPWAVFGTTTSSNSLGGFSTTLNVNGTLTLLNSPAPNDTIQNGPNSMIYLGVTSTHTAAINVGPSGVINTPQLYPNGTTAGGLAGTGSDATITVAAGGQFNISSVADFRKPTQVVTGAGAFTLLPGSRVRLGSPDGISSTGATGQIQTDTRGFAETVAYAYEGAAAQVTGNGIPATVSNLTLNNATGLTLSKTINVVDSLTLTNGVIKTGTFDLTMGTASKVQRTSGHVFGFLNKTFSSTATSRTFEIGDATKYTPVTVNFASVIAPGTLRASTTPGDHPQINSSNIDATRSVNRYYTLTNSGITFTTYDAVFNYVSTDLDATADPATFIVGDYKAGIWTYPIPGTRTATSTQSTGNTSFSDFAIGNPVAVVPVSDLISFNAKKLINSGSVTWTVAANNNIHHYELLKSNDGRNFNLLTTVNHSAGQMFYQYGDVNLTSGTNYYRLKVTDNNGVIYYSKTVAIVNKVAGIELISMSPSLVTGDFTQLNFAAAKADVVMISIVDNSGRKISETKYVIAEGNTSVRLNLPAFAAGVYNLNVYTSDVKVATLKFVKQ